MNLREFSALSFDCYGTLIDWEAGISAVLTSWAKATGSTLGEEELLVAYSVHEAAVEDEHPTMLYPDVLREAFRRTGQALGIPVTAADADRLGTSVADWPAFPDSRDALTRLKSHYKLIILSNVNDEGFAASNRHLGVAFDDIITAEQLGAYKPNPKNFSVLLQRTEQLGVTSGKLLHVAQSLFHDHVPGKAVGLDTVWIDRRHDRPGWGATPDPNAEVIPDWTFPSMSAFADAADEAFRTA